MRILPAFISILAVAACTPVSTVSRPDAYYAQAAPGHESASLFSQDAAVLGDQEIERILSFDYSPPDLSRIALMPFGRESWSEWSEELAMASARMRTEVIDRLRSSPKIYDASYLPSILIPEKKTVPHLREAAARYQADLLLVYRTFCRSFARYRLFAADEARAYCGAEAVLLDTRTGLVPFTSAVLKSYDTKESKSDLAFQETMLKAQLDATSEALGDVSVEVVRFLEQK